MFQTKMRIFEGLTCDRCQAFVGWYDTQLQAVLQAEREGWYINKDYHLCPKCVKESQLHLELPV